MQPHGGIRGLQGSAAARLLFAVHRNVVRQMNRDPLNRLKAPLNICPSWR